MAARAEEELPRRQRSLLAKEVAARAHLWQEAEAVEFALERGLEPRLDARVLGQRAEHVQQPVRA